SNVINPKQFKDFMVGTQGSFGGIGFVFGLRDGQMTVLNPIPNTPADRVGLKAGDQILFIEGEPTINMPLDTAKWKMRGDPGTKVTITIYRAEWKGNRDFTFTREEIHVDSVESYVLPKNASSPAVLYLKVKNFQKATTDEVRSAVQKAAKENPDFGGIIMDLRGNPGGLLEQAIKLSDGFMDRGAIVSTKGRTADESDRVEAMPDEQISKKPLLLLVNQGSASASEIVAGALKSSRALVVGDRTFGKGSVQKLYPLPDNGALKLTIAQYLTPNDVSIQSVGVQPDLYVYSASISSKKARMGKPVKHTLEGDLKNAFVKSGGDAELPKPMAEVQYLQKSAPAAEDGMEMEGEGMDGSPHGGTQQKSFSELSLDEKITRLGEDFLISLAQSVIGEVPEAKREGAQREELTKAAGLSVAKANEEQQKKVAAALVALGVDWSDGPAAEKGALTVFMGEDYALMAGSPAQIKITVKNTSKSPAHKVWGRTKSDNPMLDGLDFVFGKIDAGQERSWTTEVKTPKSLPSRWDPVTISLKSGSAEDVAEGKGGVISRGVPSPGFEYSYTFSEKNSDSKLSGNGVVDAGDFIELGLKVKNRGEGASGKTETTLRAEGENERIYLKSARHNFDAVKPGEVKDAPMSFEFKKADDEGKFKLVINVTDADSGAVFSDELLFTAGEKHAASEDRFPPAIKLSAPPPLRTTAAKIKLDVALTDDSKVEDFYAYLGDKKVFYKNAGQGKAAAISFEVELEEGSNILSLTASDDKQMHSSKTFIIFRAKEGQELALKTAVEGK
ncbi:PDZ domain-containing protein, partial [bacterium]